MKEDLVMVNFYPELDETKTNGEYIFVIDRSGKPYTKVFGPPREKACLRGFANNKGAEQPAHQRILISAIVIRF